MGLLEPINTRITDPEYFLDTPQQGRNPALFLLLFLLIPIVSLSLMAPFPGFFPSGCHLTEGWKTQPPITNGEWEEGGASESLFSKSEKNGGRHRRSNYSILFPRTYSTGRSWMGT